MYQSPKEFGFSRSLFFFLLEKFFISTRRSPLPASLVRCGEGEEGTRFEESGGTIPRGPAELQSPRPRWVFPVLKIRENPADRTGDDVPWTKAPGTAGSGCREGPPRARQSPKRTGRARVYRGQKHTGRPDLGAMRALPEDGKVRSRRRSEGLPRGARRS